MKTYNICISFILCLNVSFIAYSQDYGRLKYKINDVNTDKPISFAEVCLLNKETMQCVSSDFDGYFSFIVNMQEIDSAYFTIRINQEQEAMKVFINDLPVFYHYKFSYFYISLFEFERFTQSEYDKYLKRNKGLPKRTKSFARDVK